MGVSVAGIRVAGASMGGAEVGGVLDLTLANGGNGALETDRDELLLAVPKKIL